MKAILTAFCLSMVLNPVAFAGEPTCGAEASKLAPKLFALHYGESTVDTPTFSQPVLVAPLKAPSGKGVYEVNEIVAGIGKMGEFRMRFIFAVQKMTEATYCDLMGQEILDLSRR